MKLKSLHIEDYKLFKDFDIDFLGSNNKPLPIVVLAGVNGSGKTTLFESLSIEHIRKQERFIADIPDGNDDEVDVSLNILNDDESEWYREYRFQKQREHEYAGVSLSNYDYLNNIIYLSTDTTIKNIKDLMPEYLKKMVWDEDIKASEAFERVRISANNVFENMNLNIEFDSRDGEGNLYFRNKNSEKKFLIDALSTGEKTLMSKVLYLYLEEITDKVILIDEPELSLHPSWQNKVLKIYENFAKMNDCQIIIATHSPHIIGSAKAEYLRVLKKIDEKIEVFKYDKSYGLEFSQILTNIMGMDYLRTPDVAKKMQSIKTMIVANEFNSEQFQTNWNELEEMLGKNNLDLKLLKLEIASRKKNVSNS